jgi:pilus assembly protein CpaC
VRAKIGITIACLGALAVVLCASAGLKAQSSPSFSQPPASIQDSANDLSVTVGKTVLVDCQWPVARAAINLSEIAEVHATNPKEIMVMGKTPGETSLIIWDTHGGRQFYNVTVRPSSAALNDNLDAIRRELRAELPGQNVKVSSENGSIFLRGTVKDLSSASRAVKIATAGLASKDGKVVDLLDVNVPDSDPQILLKVRFMSVDRSKETQLGINVFNLGAGNFIGASTTGQYTPPQISGGSGGSGALSAGGSQATFSNELNLLGFYPGLGVGVDVQALAQKIGAEVLAEPNIVAANGKEASFLAGGEYPYPIAQGSGGAITISIDFKEYGIRLNFIPTITPRGTIRLQVAPEVSALDFTHEVEISGLDVPAITTRKVKTEVELGDNQSFVIGGLLDNEESETFSKVPFLGDIPVLGKFFQSMQKLRSNTELLVIVTPEIVAPIPAGTPAPDLKYPAKFLPPNSGVPMNTPDAKTAANTPPPTPPTMPVEKLIDSMKAEPPLVIEGGTGGFGASSSGSTGGASTSSAPSYSPPQ